jgi:cobalt transporter subunit CbtB
MFTPTGDRITQLFEGTTMQTSIAIPAGNTNVWAISQRLPALVVLFIGLVVVYAVGFSSLPRAHNAAHDTRHASGFPCH